MIGDKMNTELIEELKEVGSSQLISITEKGRKVAEKLREIDKIMEGGEDDDSHKD